MRPGILHADVDLQKSIPGPVIHDTTGHDNRLSILSLHFNRTPTNALTLEGPKPPEIPMGPGRGAFVGLGLAEAALRVRVGRVLPGVLERIAWQPGRHDVRAEH